MTETYRDAVTVSGDWGDDPEDVAVADNRVDARKGTLTVQLAPQTLRRLRRQATQMGVASPADFAAQMLDRMRSPAHPAPGDVAADHAPAPEGRRQDTGLRAYAPYLVVTGRRPRLAGVLAWIREQADLVHVVADLDQAANLVHAGRYSCAVIDADSLGDLAHVVGAVVSLRDQRPNLPVILVTAGVRRDNYELERLPLCDVTLRHPVDPETFAFAVQEAQVNNRVWIARRRALHLCRAEAAAPAWATR